MFRAKGSSVAMFLKRAFAPREIFFFWDDRFRYLRLSARAQKIAAGGASLVLAWGLIATAGNILDKRNLASKEKDIARQELAHAALERDLARLLERRAEREARIAALGAGLSRERAARLALRGQRDSQARRIGELERRLVDLRESELVMIERLGDQAREGSDIAEKTIAMTGLDADALIAGRADADSRQADLAPAGLGRGGPFVPADGAAADLPPEIEPARTLSRIEVQLARWSVLREVLRSLPLTAPLDQYRISSTFGRRHDPMTGRKARHMGIDFVAPPGTPIHATAPGTVVFAGRQGRYGRTVEIDHGYGVRTRYAHLSRILVENGQEIEHRARIGLLGSSGRSTGPHVHYEIRFEGQAQNPMKYILAGQHLFKD